MRWKALLDREFLIVAFSGAGLAHCAARLAQLVRPDLSYWGIVTAVYTTVLLGFWALVRRAEHEADLLASGAPDNRARVLALPLIEAAREARRLLSDERFFQHTPATDESPPIIAGVPDNIRALFEKSERVELVDGDLTFARAALAFLPGRKLQVGRWSAIEGGEYSVQVLLNSGEASLWTHTDEDDAELESLPSLFHLIVYLAG